MPNLAPTTRARLLQALTALKIPHDLYELTPQTIITRAALARPRHHAHPLRCSVSPTLEHNVLLPSLQVQLCCQDYALSSPLGSLRTTHYDALERPQRPELCARCHLAEPAT